MMTRTFLGIPVVTVDGQPPPSQYAFDAAWDRADRIAGWLTEAEAKELYGAAIRTPRTGLIVEVGSFMGRSLTLLAASGRRVIAIDPLQFGASIAKCIISKETVAGLQSVVDSYPNVSWIRQRSCDVACPRSIDLLYVDACHRYPYPLNDFLALRPGLRHGVLVAFHDYGREFGVTKSVDELVAGGVIEPLAKSETMFVGTVL